MICTRPFLDNIICRNLFASEDQITQVMEFSGVYFLKTRRPVSGRDEEPRASRSTTIFRKSIDEFLCHDGMSMGRTFGFRQPERLIQRKSKRLFDGFVCNPLFVAVLR